MLLLAFLALNMGLLYLFGQRIRKIERVWKIIWKIKAFIVKDKFYLVRPIFESVLLFQTSVQLCKMFSTEFLPTRIGNVYLLPWKWLWNPWWDASLVPLASHFKTNFATLSFGHFYVLEFWTVGRRVVLGLPLPN